MNQEDKDRINNIIQNHSKHNFDLELISENEINGEKIYYAKQKYPYVVTMYDPITFNITHIIIDKNNKSEITREIIKFIG